MLELYFGDCVEGERFYGLLVPAVASLADQCKRQATLARALGEQCQIAGQAIDETDAQAPAI
ncbi:hypothetical protein AS181_05070 [Gordonia sp. SGD-V-85]|nr:hypothetical protein AS181_05070 [Gordonia sp. SGD-V-85]